MLVLLGGLLAFPASVALWEQRTLNDEAQFVSLGHEILREKPVQDAIAGTIARQIREGGGVDPGGRGIIDRNIEGLTRGIVSGLVDSEVGDAALRQTYAVALVLAEVDSAQRPVEMQGDKLIFDLRPAVRSLVADVEALDPLLRGRIVLPPDAGLIVIAEGENIRLGLDVFRIVDRAAPVLIVLPLIAFGLALLVASNRWLALLLIGVVVAGGALLRIILLQGPIDSLLVDLVAGDALYGDAGVAVYGRLVSSFVRQDVLVLAGGIVAIGVGLAGGVVSRAAGH